MAKRGGMYSSNKRAKEIKRQKKQEEKKQKRLNNAKALQEGSDEAEPIDPEQETEGTSEEKEADTEQDQ